MICIGVDLGYGDTKVVGPDGQRVKFPSRWAKYDLKSWGIGGNTLALRIDDGDPFLFGDNATGPSVREPQGDGRLADPDSLPLLAAALWMSGAGADGNQTPVIIGSGTPLGRFEQEVTAAREALQGKELTISSATGEKRQFIITKLVARPQGVGAALYLLEKGQIKQQMGYGVVVDIGSRTTDVLTINLQNMEPVVDLCFSIQVGIGDAVSEVGKAIARETGFIVPTEVAHKALTSTVMFKQREVGGPKVSGPILESLSNRIIDRLREYLRGELDMITALIPVGGGASLIGDRLEVLAPGVMVKISPEDAPFANALGYKDAAERVSAKA